MDFDAQPTLHGPTLIARPLRASDLELLYAVARDPLLWAQHPDQDRWRRDVFEAFFAEALAGGGALTVLRADDGAVVGSSRFHDPDPAASTVEIGWTFLARSLWGGPANRELKALMLEHAFASFGRVLFVVGPDNRRSRRAVEKLGARRIATRPHPPGPDWIVYALDRTGRG